MGRRSARKAKNRDQDPPDALKMVLKLSAKEYADSQPASPSLSAISNDSDNDSTNRAGSKRSRKSQGQAPPAKLARKGIGINRLIPSIFQTLFTDRMLLPSR